MSTYSARRCLALVACLAVTAVVIPATASAITKLEKKQNRALVKQKRALAKQQKALIAAQTAITSLFGKDTSQDAKDTSQDGTNKTQDEGIASVNGKVDGILAAVPEVVTNLTAAGEGLKALKAALETQVSPALTTLAANLTLVGTNLQTAGANLVALAGAFQSVEYGVARVSATNGTIPAGGFITSSDVPDDGNAAVANGTAILVATGTPVTVDLKADIRSNEGDNALASTVGQAGGFVYVKSTQQSFTDNDADVDPGGGVVAANRDASDSVQQRVACTGAPNPPGILGTVAGESIVTPTGPVTNLPVVNLAGGVTRTDQTHPDGASKSLLNAATCSFAATPGQVYEVTYSVNFVDIPTSATPGGTE